MSVLTKVLVLLVTVLAVVLSTLMIAFVADVDDLKGQLRQAKEAQTVAEARARTKEGELSSAHQRLNELYSSMESAVSSLMTENNTLETNLADRAAELASAKGQIAQLSSDLSRLTGAEQQLAEFVTVQENELKNRREAMVKLQTQRVQLIDRINELEGGLNTATRSVRYLQEDIHAKQIRIDDLHAQISRLPVEWQVTIRTEQIEEEIGFESSTFIAGRVKQISQYDGATLVALDVGSNDSVKPGMKFRVHRGNQFLASMIIRLVDANESAGRIDFGQGVAVGDEVQSGPR